MSLEVLQWGLLAFFLVPLVEVALLIVGVAWAQFAYKKAPPGKYTHLILQITTVGDEPDLVRKTIAKIRSYRLVLSYEIWVVVEPKKVTDYRQANRVFVVPRQFPCKAIDRARALEYSRVMRQLLNLNRRDVKVLLIDDDTLPSKVYIEKAFYADYDICQGVTVPNRWYGGVSVKHFFLSHLDNIRTRNCLIYCSVSQGLLQKPLFVHGEGLCFTGAAEEVITWNRPIVASDDLVFGTNAAHLGFSWGFFLGAVQLVSPWRFRDSLTQRRRWTWGNLTAIWRRDIMPLEYAIPKAAKYLFGFISTTCSATGAVLTLQGIAKIPPQAHTVFWISLACWVSSYALCGFINSGGEPNRERIPEWYNYVGFRILQTFAAAVLTPIVAISPVLVISYSILRGRPKRFMMIPKSQPVQKK